MFQQGETLMKKGNQRLKNNTDLFSHVKIVMLVCLVWTNVLGLDVSPSPCI